ncbi:MAG: hypothetical protein HYZ49_13240 [Chloroflexi bacterium]|nr:hypothetical protein [Chloroflexota bacterium]
MKKLEVVPNPWLRLMRYAWVVTAVLAFGILIAALPHYYARVLVEAANQLVDGPPEFVFAMDFIGTFASVLAAVVSLAVAVLLFRRKARDGMALFLSFFLLGYGTMMAGPLEALFDFGGPGSEFALLAQTGLLTAPMIAFGFLFPNGRFVPRWSRGLLVISLFLLPLLASTPVSQWFSTPTPATLVGEFGLGALLLAALGAQVHRYRRVSNFDERQQTKWVLYGFVLFFALIVVLTIPYSILEAIPKGRRIPWWGPLNGALWWLSLCVLPVSIALAILRHRLYDIDILIRRTLQYSVLTGLLAFTYFGSIVVLQSIFTAVTGQQSPVVLVLSTLAIAALFFPLRNRVQDFIDRRFFRKKYDAAKVIAEFAATCRDETDLDKLTARLVEVVDETMQPESVTLWLKDSNAKPQRREGAKE